MVPDLDERIAAIAEAHAAGRDNLAGKIALRLVERLVEAGVGGAPDAAEVARLRSAAELFGRAIDLLRAALEGPLRDLLRPGDSLIDDGIPALIAEVRRLHVEAVLVDWAQATLGAAFSGPLADLCPAGDSYFYRGIPALIAEVRRLRALEGNRHA